FFFSSRRRHTRSDRDWSSDVCSSDLRDLRVRLVRELRIDRHDASARTNDRVDARPIAIGELRLVRARGQAVAQEALEHELAETRSEERRVGKECRSRWWEEH